MRILVLGATGYLGSHIARHLAASDHQVSGLSRSSDRDAALEADGVAALRGDLTQRDAIIDMMREHDATIYAAQLMLQEEFDTIAGLLKAMEGRSHSFLFTSGTGLLSQRTDGAWSEDSFAEDDPFIPSKYIRYRLVTETMIRQAVTLGRLRPMVVRAPII